MEAPTLVALTPHLRYVDEFIGTLDCAPRLLELRLMPNSKELSETVAAFHAIRTHLPSFSLQDENVSLVAVGDGATPRLAALAAFLTRWTCHSVDPLLPPINRWTMVDRLHVHRGKIEDFRFKSPRCVVVLMHAHVPLPKALESIASESIGIIVCPCCDFYEKHKLERPPDIEFADWGILSPHRLLRIWRPSGAPPVAPLTALEISPVQAQADEANRLGISLPDSAWLLKCNLVAYFEALRSAGLVQPMNFLRLAARLAATIANGRSISSFPPAWLAEVALRPVLHAERRELLRQVLIAGKSPAEMDSLASSTAVRLRQFFFTSAPITDYESLRKELFRAASDRPGLREDLSTGEPRAQLVSYLVGVLIKGRGKAVSPQLLREKVVLPFCKEIASGSEAPQDEEALDAESDLRPDG